MLRLLFKKEAYAIAFELFSNNVIVAKRGTSLLEFINISRKLICNHILSSVNYRRLHKIICNDSEEI